MQVNYSATCQNMRLQKFVRSTLTGIFKPRHCRRFATSTGGIKLGSTGVDTDTDNVALLELQVAVLLILHLRFC